MTEPNKPRPGTIFWVDLTIPNAEEVRDFYHQVVGWQASGVDMGGYEDFNMAVPGAEQAAAGICHARGANKDLPSQWLIYIIVENLEVSMKACEANGGKVLVSPKNIGSGHYCVIQDPAGAVAALYELADEPAES